MEIPQLPKDKKIVLFDGQCNLCDSLVQYLIKHDRKKDILRFASLQSELGIKILRHIGVDPDKIESIILYEPGTSFYNKAEAVIQISKSLGGINAASLFRIVPRFLRNSVYDHIAKNRYKWFGKKEHCMVPTPEILSKFL
jgi:predicted DCC family thiol-disulfide oxidoreductase YuxK